MKKQYGILGGIALCLLAVAVVFCLLRKHTGRKRGVKEG